MRPVYIPTDVLGRARSASFNQRAERDLWALTRSVEWDDDITGLSKLIEPPQLELQAAPAQEPLPIVVSDRPDAMQLQRQAQERQMPQQPMMQPQQQAPAAASGMPQAMPTASQDGQPAQPAQRPMALPTGSEGGDYGPIDNSSRAAFVRTAYPYMLEAAGGDKNLAELMLAKAISENGDVGSGGGFIGNNFSGIKGEGDAGSFEADTWEDYGNGRVNIRDRFAAYSTPQVGFRAFMQFLHDNSRYAPALARYQQTGDASQLFRDIRAAGYATDPLWADKVENIRANQVAPIVRGQADQDMQRLSLNAAPAAAPGRTAPPAPAGVASTPAGAPPAPWETAGASDGGPMLLKENDETAPMGGGDAMLPGDGGFAPTPEYDPRAVDEGPRESRPAPILPTDPTVSDPAYTQSPTGMTYGPVEQGDVQGPAMPAPVQNQITRYVPTYEAQAAQVAPTMPTPAAGAVQAGIDAAVESYNDPFYQAGPQPPRWVKIVSDAMQAFGTESAKNVARSLGVTDEEWFSVFGFPISRVDVAGFAGGIAADPTNYVGLNMADPLVTVARGAVRDFAPEAVKNVGRAVGSTLREGAEALGRGLQGVGREVAGGLMDLNPAMTPRIIGDGPGIGRSMPGPDDVPTPPAVGRPQQRTVEWLAEQIDYTKRVLDDLDPATEGELIGQVQDRLGRLQGEWVDAVNARRALEPRIRSEVGRRAEDMPVHERLAGNDYPMVGQERVSPEDGIPRTVDDTPRSPGLNSAVPFDPASAAAGGAAGAMSEGEDGEQGDPLRTAGALAVAGIMGRKFPGMQRAIDASQRRAAAMAARGIKPLNPLQWAGEAVKTAGYSSMIGIRTATVNMAGNVFEPIWGVPKEGARAVARAVERKNPAALREPGEMFFGALTGLSETGGEILQALRGQGRYGSSPDHPFLSERTINPVGHALASGMEFGGRVFSGVPDAFFGTIARRAGERRAAAQIATDAGLRGDAWKARVAQILNDRDEIDAYMRTRASLAGQASSNALMPGQPAAMVDPDRMAAVEKMVKDGGAHADDMTYRNKLGTWGEGFKNFVTFGNTPVVGTLTAPFVTTPWNARTRMLEKTPIGFGMNTYNRPGTARTRFDKWYDAALGTPLLIGLAMGPAAAGRVTGSGPSDPNERKTMEENGWKPYSTLVTAPDGNEYYIPNRNIGNWGLALNVIGEIHDEMAYQKPGRTPRDQIESVARRVGRIMQDDVYAGGLVDLVGLLTEPDQTGMGWVAQQAARLTPYAATARDISTAMDPNERERPEQGDTWVGMGTELRQRWQQATGQRSELDPKTNAKGEPMPNEQAGWRAFAPRATQAKHDPIIKEILANDAQLGKPREAFTVTATGSDAPDGGVGTGKVKLNRMEQAQWKRHRWEYIQNVYAELMADQEFQSAPESIKQKIWRGQMTSAGKYADGMIKEQWGDAEYERRVNEAFGNLRARAS